MADDFKNKLNSILGSLGLRNTSAQNAASGASTYSAQGGATNAAQASMTATAISMALQPLVQQIQALSMQIQSLNSTMQSGGHGGSGGGGYSIPRSPGTGGGGGFWAQTFERAGWSNFTPQGLFSSGMSVASERFGPGAGIIGAGFTVAQTIDASVRAWSAPLYETDIALASAGVGGQYINSIQRAGMMHVADLEGRLGAARQIGSLIDWIPGVGWLDDKLAYRPLERRIAVSKAQTDRAMIDQQIALRGGSIPGVGDATAGLQRDAVMIFGRFGSGVGRGMQGLPFAQMREIGATDADVTGMLEAVSGYASRPQFSSVRRAAMRGDTAGAARLALQFASESGDFSALDALMPYFNAGSSSDKTLLAAASSRADVMSGLFSSAAIARSGLGSAEAGLRAMQSSGFGYKDIKAQLGFLGGGIDRNIGILQQILVGTTNEQSRASLLENIDNLTASRAGLARAGFDIEYSQRGQSLSAGIRTARLGVETAIFGGGSTADITGAYGREAGQTRQMARLYREKSHNPSYTESERREAASMAAQLEQEANLFLPRQAGLEAYGIASGQAGLLGAQGQYAMTGARLFGSSGDVRSAGAIMASGIDAQIAAITELLNKTKLGKKEELEYQTQIVGLSRERVQLERETLRGAARQDLGIASTRADIAGIERSTAFLSGIGGMEGLQYGLSTLQGARGRTQAAQHVLRTLQRQGVSKDNPEYIEAQRDLAAARQEEAGAAVGLANTPFAAADENRYRQAQFSASVLSMLPGAYGNLRGAYKDIYEGSQSRVSQLQQQKAAALAQAAPSMRDAIALQFDDRIRREAMTGAQAFQQMSYGWESRLISQTLGTPGSFGYVANEFSMSRVIGARIRNPLFGAGSAAESLAYRDDAGYSGSIAGATGTPEGFAVTALAGRMPMAGGMAANMPAFPTADDRGQGAGNPADRKDITVTIRLVNEAGAQIGMGTINLGNGGGAGENGSTEQETNFRVVMQNGGNV